MSLQAAAATAALFHPVTSRSRASHGSVFVAAEWDSFRRLVEQPLADSPQLTPRAYLQEASVAVAAVSIGVLLDLFRFLHRRLGFRAGENSAGNSDRSRKKGGRSSKPASLFAASVAQHPLRASIDQVYSGRAKMKTRAQDSTDLRAGSDRPLPRQSSGQPAVSVIAAQSALSQHPNPGSATVVDPFMRTASWSSSCGLFASLTAAIAWQTILG